MIEAVKPLVSDSGPGLARPFDRGVPVRREFLGTECVDARHDIWYGKRECAHRLMLRCQQIVDSKGVKSGSRNSLLDSRASHGSGYRPFMLIRVVPLPSNFRIHLSLT
jgi:hypothetical protein